MLIFEKSVLYENESSAVAFSIKEAKSTIISPVFMYFDCLDRLPEGPQTQTDFVRMNGNVAKNLLTLEDCIANSSIIMYWIFCNA